MLNLSGAITVDQPWVLLLLAVLAPLAAVLAYAARRARRDLRHPPGLLQLCHANRRRRGAGRVALLQVLGDVGRAVAGSSGRRCSTVQRCHAFHA